VIIIRPSDTKKDEDKKDEDKKDDGKKKKEDEDISSAPARLIVSLPAEAKLKIEGEATKSTGSERTFVTPTLEAGKTYSWTLDVEVMQDDKPVTWTQKVSLEPGKTARVSLTVPVRD
jgi:uncharacterized protein (TIGR03000 family)